MASSLAVLGPPMAALGAFVVMLILPGFGVRRYLLRQDDVSSATIVPALAIGVLALACAAAPLIAGGWFSRDAMVVVTVTLGLAGVRDAVRWIRVSRAHFLAAALLFVMGVSWAETAMAEGFPPSHTLQWYYWGLGQQLGNVGGLPEWSVEYGQRVRFLPDYLFFNVLSETYAGLTAFLSPATAIAAWRFPVALLGLGMVYSVLLLWIPRRVALVGVGFVVVTIFFEHKFNAYKPESVGLVVGLCAVWLLVTGLRTRQWRQVGLAGATVGLAVGIHGIAATFCGLALVAAGLVELAGLPRVERGAGLRALMVGGVLAVGVVVTSGVGLQGRAAVAGDALKPRLVDGVDPTWRFMQLDMGRRAVSPTMSLSEQFERAAPKMVRPWRKTRLDEFPGAFFGVFTLLGLALLWRKGDVRARRGVVTLVGLTGLLALAIAFFSLRFETYVPRNTGLSRFAQYVPFLVGMATACAAAGFHAAWRERVRQADDAATRLYGAVVLVAWILALTAVNRAGKELPTIRRSVLDAWAFLREAAGPGDAVLANAHTAGSIEFFTGLEAPLEGRQPLIEDVTFMNRASEAMATAFEFFAMPADPALTPRWEDYLESLEVRWVVAAGMHRQFGASRGFGGRVGDLLEAPYLKVRWQARGVAILERTAAKPRSTEVAAPVANLGNLAAAGICLFLFVLVSCRWLLPPEAGARRSGSPTSA